MKILSKEQGNTADKLVLAGKIIQVLGNEWENTDFKWKVYDALTGGLEDEIELHNGDIEEVNFYVDDYLTNLNNFTEHTNEHLLSVCKKFDLNWRNF
jgi:hypothetical protein